MPAAATIQHHHFCTLYYVCGIHKLTYKTIDGWNDWDRRQKKVVSCETAFDCYAICGQFYPMRHPHTHIHRKWYTKPKMCRSHKNCTIMDLRKFIYTYATAIASDTKENRLFVVGFTIQILCLMKSHRRKPKSTHHQNVVQKKENQIKNKIERNGKNKKQN